MSGVTRILSQIEQGDPTAAEKLLPMVYNELRKLAARKLANENPGHTLDATALVHEAYIRLVDTRLAQRWENRSHFFAAAAEAMRRILIDSARRKASAKRGGGRNRQILNESAVSAQQDAGELLGLDEALGKLAGVNAMAAELVKLRYFAGLTMDQAAEVLGISTRTAYYTWTYARSWLRREMQDD